MARQGSYNDGDTKLATRSELSRSISSVSGSLFGRVAVRWGALAQWSLCGRRWVHGLHSSIPLPSTKYSVLRRFTFPNLSFTFPL